MSMYCSWDRCRVIFLLREFMIIWPERVDYEAATNKLLWYLLKVDSQIIWGAHNTLPLKGIHALSQKRKSIRSKFPLTRIFLMSFFVTTSVPLQPCFIFPSVLCLGELTVSLFESQIFQLIFLKFCAALWKQNSIIYLLIHHLVLSDCESITTGWWSCFSFIQVYQKVGLSFLSASLRQKSSLMPNFRTAVSSAVKERLGTT